VQLAKRPPTYPRSTSRRQALFAPEEIVGVAPLGLAGLGPLAVLSAPAEPAASQVGNFVQVAPYVLDQAAPDSAGEGATLLGWPSIWTDAAPVNLAEAAESVVGNRACANGGYPVGGVLGGLTEANLYGLTTDFTATITWGDNSSSTGTVTQLDAGVFAVQGSHTYAQVGNYTIQVGIVDDGGQSTSFTTMAFISQAQWTLAGGTPATRGDDPERAYLVSEGEATVDLNQGALRLSQPLDFDQSPGTSVGGNPALVYNSATVDVRPIIQMTLSGPGYGPAPTQVQLQLTWNGVQQTPVTFSLAGMTNSQTVYLALQVANPVLQSGYYAWSVSGTITFNNNTTAPVSTSGTSYVVARDGSPYGAGWGIDGISQLVIGTAGVLQVTGQGDWRFFTNNGNGTFTPMAEDLGSLVQNGDGSYTYIAKDQTKYNYTSAGLLSSVVDTHSLTLQAYQYDGLGRLTGVNAVDGGVTVLNYDLITGLLDSINEPGGRVVTLTHTGTALTQILDADNTTRSFGYDGLNHLTSDSWAPLNAAFTYDPNSGLLTNVNRGLGTTYTIVSAESDGLGAYWLGPAWASITDALTHTTKYLLDGRGRLLQLIMADGVNKWTYLRDAAGQPVLSLDPNGGATLDIYVYGPYNSTLGGGDGDLVEQFNPDTSWVKYTYDPTFHHVTSTANSIGQTTSATYDPVTGDLLTSTDGVGNQTSYAYYLQGNGVSTGLVSSVTTPTLLGTATSYYAYDAHRRLVVSTDAAGAPTLYGYDANGNVSTTTDANGHATFTLYSADNLLLRSTDADGGVTSYQYNPYGEQIAVTNPRGFTATTQYDQRGLVTTRTDYLGNTVEQDSYDAATNLTAQTDGDGNTTQFSYDADNRQTLTTDALGNPYATAYDGDSNVTSTTAPLGRKTQYTYDLMDRPTSELDPAGRLSRSGYDGAGDLIRSVDPRGLATLNFYDADNRVVQSAQQASKGQWALTQTVYDPAGNVYESIDPLGFLTQNYYDADNRPVETIDPTGAATLTSYDPVGNVASTTDGRGQVTQYFYDAVNEAIGVLDPNNDLTQTVYNAAGDVVQTIDPRQNVTVTTVDADGRPVAVLDGDHYVSTTTYDAAGNVVLSVDNNGGATRYVYDKDNREVLRTDPNNHSAQTVYNPAGDVIDTVDGAGDQSMTAYDGDDEATAQQNPDGAVTQETLNGDGAVTAVTDADLNTTNYQLDPLGNVVATTDALGHTGTAQYDLGGRQVSRTDRDGRTITDGYDGDGRVMQETWYNANGSVQNTFNYAYDGNGNLLSASNNYGGYTFSYDASSRLQTQTDPFHLTLTYGYDAASNVSSVTDSFGGSLTNYHDADNRLTSRQYSGPGGQARVDATYTPAGQEATLTRYRDSAGTQEVAQTANTYDKALNLTDSKNSSVTGVVLSDYQYSYDAADRAISATATHLGVSTNTPYSYDQASQVTAAGSQNYSYDANGNRTMSGYQTGGNNELTTDGTWTYSYDAEGNLISKSKGSGSSQVTWTYGYDDANQLLSAVQTTGGVTTLQVTYSYDVFGNRVEEDKTKSGSTTVTRHAFDANGNVWADLNSSNQLLAAYVYGAGTNEVWARVVSAGQPNAGVAWYFTDSLGSVRDLIDNNAVVQDQLNYDAYGVVTETNAAFGDEFGYAGGKYDRDTALEQFGARYYYAAAGRWQQQDPVAFGAGDSNLYRYVRNGPTNATDPSGLRECDDRETPQTKNLKNCNAILEKMVNNVIQEEFKAAKRANLSGRQFAAAVYERLGTDAPQTGVDAPLLGSVSRVTRAAVLLEKALADAGPDYIVQVNFKDSRYRNNPISLYKAGSGGIPWFATAATAQHGLAPTIRVSGTLMGTDKWEHFFQQGYWTWYGYERGFLLNQDDINKFQDFLEGDYDTKGQFRVTTERHALIVNLPKTEWIGNTRYYFMLAQRFNPKFDNVGYFGLYATGVASQADKKANLAGYTFYKDLVHDYENGEVYHFSVADFDTKSFNESVNTPSKFLRTIRVDD
jgi:RHS repeat-associated protein